MVCAPGAYNASVLIRDSSRVPLAVGATRSFVASTMSAPADDFVRSADSVVPVVARPVFPRSLPPIPDARSAAADLNLRWVDLNRTITRSYGQMGILYQNIIEPGFEGAPPHGSGVLPTWFAIGAFASRGAGRGEIAAGLAKQVLDRARFDGMPDVDEPCGGSATFDAGEEAALRGVFPQLSAEDAGSLCQDMRSNFFGRRDRQAALFMVALGLGMQHDASQVIRSGLLDPRILAISVKRLVKLAESANAPNFADGLRAVADTIRNGLEDGNRRILADVGGAGQGYLEWRQQLGTAPTPQTVLDKFSTTPRGVWGVSPRSVQQAHAFYDFGVGAVDAGGALPTDLASRFPEDRWDSANMLVAGFALYEAARLEPSHDRKNRLITMANNYLAFREQFHAVQPAFTPGRVYPGEVDRMGVWQLMSPGVELETRPKTWWYTRYAADNLPPRDGSSIWTPRVTQYNWGAFDDRWTPILNSFDMIYSVADQMWPPPDPEPTHRP